MRSTAEVSEGGRGKTGIREKSTTTEPIDTWLRWIAPEREDGSGDAEGTVPDTVSGDGKKARKVRNRENIKRQQISEAITDVDGHQGIRN